MSRSVGRVCAGFYLALSLAASYILFGSEVALPDPGLGDLPVIIVLALHYLWGAALLLSSTEYRRLTRRALRTFLIVPELLGALSLLLFLFTYIFAINANMDYVQRFIATGGALRLAIDTETERLYAWVRFFPFVALDFGTYLLLRIGRYGAVVASGKRASPFADKVARPWSLILVLAGAFLVALSQPSFASLQGVSVLGWLAYVPLFLVLRTSRPSHALFYGVVFGSVSTVLVNYWLGTFSLVSLQITVLFFLVYYLAFSAAVVPIYRRVRFARVVVFPLAMVIFEYLHSIGFLGYPWGLAGHSQYSFTPLIQMASVTGVWGVSFVVLLANSAVSELLGASIERVSTARGSPRQLAGRQRTAFRWLTLVAALVGVVVFSGAMVLASHAEPEESREVRFALVQQSTDPRKHEYEQTFDILKELTNRALEQDPDLVVWSETAFVPNIRRWEHDTGSLRYHRLVTDLLDYQRSIRTWLLTGNDDYEIVDEEGSEARYEYNAAVLFSAAGERRETYRKIQLVPFTEYFPYRAQLPWAYELLLHYDVNFWEQGTEYTVFEHPLVRFSTPICYEDVFPDYVRHFVLAGSEAIVNISNDYWSLTPVQAKQHFVAGMFRAVENRRPVLRATASGLTGHIDPFGRIRATAPYYEPALLVADVPIDSDAGLTIYTRHGDYFPIAAAGALALLIAGSLLVRPAASSAPAERASAPTAAAPTVPDTTAPPAAPVRAARARTEAARAPKEGAPAPASRPAPVAGPLPKNEEPAERAGRRKRREKTNWRAIWDDPPRALPRRVVHGRMTWRSP